MLDRQAGAIPPGWHSEGRPPDQEWKLPLALAVALHVAVVVMALASPILFERRTLPEIHTVNLFNAVEPGPAAPVAKGKKAPAEKKAAPPAVEPQPQPKPQPQPPPVKTVEPTPIKKEAPPTPPAPTAVPVKAPAISERPLPAKTAKDLAKLKEIKRALADQQAKEAEKNAVRQVKNAVASIRDLLQNERVTDAAPAVTAPGPAAEPAPAAVAADPSPAGESGGSGGGQGAIVDEALRRYLAAVNARIHLYWKLPDLQTWDDSLEAVYIITIRKDGIVIKSEFETRSKNLHFNNFVEKAIRDASPLPPIPPELREQELEVGLRFRPGEIL